MWILLRNTGVFYESEQDYFEQLRERMVAYYRHNAVAGSSVDFMAYLLDYDAVILEKEGPTITQHDLVHLLIMLGRYPFLSHSPHAIQQRLTEVLTEYIVTVAREIPGPTFQYYLMEMSPARIVEAGSIVIVSNNLYPRVDWGVFKEHLPRETFGRLMHRTTVEYVTTSGKYF